MSSEITRTIISTDFVPAKIAMFGDIHFGAQQNSVQHNIDCIAFITFFIEQVKEKKCDAIIFLGDWFENRIEGHGTYTWIDGR